MKDEQKQRRIEEIKREITEASIELRTNGDPHAACARIIDAVLMLTAFLESL